MKKFLSTTVLLSSLFGLPSYNSAAAEIRLASVDLNKVFTNYWKTIQAGNILQKTRDDLGEEFRKMVKQGDALKAEYDKAVEDASDPGVSAEEREKRKKAVQAKKDELDGLKRTIEQYDASAKVRLGEQHRRMVEGILGEVKVAVTNMAKASAYDWVIDTSAESANNKTLILVFTNGK